MTPTPSTMPSACDDPIEAEAAPRWSGSNWSGIIAVNAAEATATDADTPTQQMATSHAS